VIEIKIYDIAGRQVKMLRGRAGEAIRFGDELKAGVYIAQVLQGEKRKEIKLVKQ
jgi:hypothetical protein